MPVFEIRNDEVVPFREVTPGPDLYEVEVESLLWSNLEEFTGVALFPLRRQVTLPGGGRPDIVALAGDGSVFVVEVKRNVDRSQLAQCLEYAGWARTTNLDELATLYDGGPAAFFRDWQEFTGTPTPVVLSRYPKLVLAARDFHGRTQSALDYLLGYGLPVQLLRIRFYEDSERRRLVDVEREEESESERPAEVPAGADGEVEVPRLDFAGRTRQSRSRPSLSEFLEAGVLSVGEEVAWTRPQLGVTYTATITPEGELRLPDGRTFYSPSSAGVAAAGIPTLNGWISWRAPQRGNRTLDELHDELLRKLDN